MEVAGWYAGRRVGEAPRENGRSTGVEGGNARGVRGRVGGYERRPRGRRREGSRRPDSTKGKVLDGGQRRYSAATDETLQRTTRQYEPARCSTYSRSGVSHIASRGWISHASSLPPAAPETASTGRLPANRAAPSAFLPRPALDYLYPSSTSAAASGISPPLTPSRTLFSLSLSLPAQLGPS